MSESKLKPTSKRSIYMFYCMFVAFTCDCANGYDGSVMSSVLAMSHFQSYFNAGTNINTSLIFSIYTAGSMFSAPIAATFNDKFGRRLTMALGVVIVILGGVLSATTRGVPQLVAARFFLGFGVAIMTNASPAYVAELAPPQWRGRCVGLYNLGWFGGAIPGAAITYGCAFLNNDLQWRIPLALQCFACVFVLANLWFMPESPRWLFMRGREEEALQFLIEYHGDGNSNSPIVHFEIGEWREGIAQDGIDKRWWDYGPLLTDHANRWRLLQVFLISLIPGYTTGGTAYFNTFIYDMVGLTSTSKQLMINLIGQFISSAAAISAGLLSDKIPRRAALIWGTVAVACFQLLNAGLTKYAADRIQAGGSHTSDGFGISYGFSIATIAVGQLSGIAYCFGYTPLQAVVPTEALETTTRAKGLAFSSFILGAVGFIGQFAAPIGLKNMGYNYMWVFVGLDFFWIAIFYFFTVESQGRTLEELAYIYAQPNPVSASKRKEKIIIEGTGNVEIVEENVV